MTPFQRLVAYGQAALPMALAAGLAGFTWWLIQASPKDEGPAAPRVVPSVPDYELNGAHLARFDAQGRLMAVLDGRAIRHYPQGDLLKIDQLVLSARDEKGQGLHAVANEGHADGMAKVVTIQGGAKVVAMPAATGASAASAPGHQAEAKGHAGQSDAARLARQGPIHITGEVLTVNAQTHVLTSDQPVTVENDAGVIQAQSLRYDQLQGISDLGGGVRGAYHPATPK